MSYSITRRVRRTTLSALATLAVTGLVTTGGAFAAPSGQGGQTTQRFSAGNYVVVLTGAPTASYTGGVAGLAPTRPQSGRQLKAQSNDSQRYRNYLRGEQDKVARRAGVNPRTHYTVALNGFAAHLSASQAAKLAATKGVLTVAKDTVHQAVTVQTPEELGLTGRDGVWQKNFGGPDGAGKGVVVGVIDTGVWPENPSFDGKKFKKKQSPSDPYAAWSPDGGTTTVMNKTDGSQFTGTCQAGADNSFAGKCNTKIISARYFGDGYLSVYPPSTLSQYEHVSPRDGDGHGSHTSSTAAGDYGVKVTIDNTFYGRASGMAPAASIAVYKALWDNANPSLSGGFTSDLVNAIDQATADGVDVINYSIGSSSESTPYDPIQLAFLSAASAGIFVSAAAGNSGPGASTLDNISPWLTTVAAATTKPREGTAVLGNGAKYAGASLIQAAVGPKPLLRSDLVPAAGVSAADAKLCKPGSLDATKVSGNIVVCARGVIDRVAKSAEVKRAGGVGMILANLTPNSVNADIHSVPTVHLDAATGGTATWTYAATSGATATLKPGNLTGHPTPYPQIAGFSSRGPSTTTGGNLLKPDIAAPGVDVIAAVAPGPHQGRQWDFESGTSMATPHIAGLAALFFTKWPNWSPMAVKSAIMTTAKDTLNADGSPNTDPFAQGAGHVDPTRFFNPGVVYDSGPADWLAFLGGLGIDTGTGIAPIDPSDLNVPSIGVGSLPGTKTVTRSLTAVTPGLYYGTVSGVPGVKVTVSPSVLNFSSAGQTKQFKVTFTRTTATVDNWTTGFLTWSGGHTTARSPIAVKPVAVAAPAEVHGSGASGSQNVTITSGVSGTLAVSTAGLAKGDRTQSQVSAGQDALFPYNTTQPSSLARFDVTGPAGADVDLFVYAVDSSGNPVALVGSSAGPTANERVDVRDLPAGNYLIDVAGFADVPGTTSTPFILTTYAVNPGTTLGNLTVKPNPVPVQQGQPATFSVSWSGLDATAPYLGWLGYQGTSTVRTIVSVN